MSVCTIINNEGALKELKTTKLQKGHGTNTGTPTTSGVFYERKMMDHGIHCALREITSSVSRVAPVTTVCARPGAAEPHFVEIFSNTSCDRGGGI